MRKIWLSIIILSSCTLNNAMEQSSKETEAGSDGSISPIGSPRGSFEEIIFQGLAPREKALIRNTAMCEKLVKDKITVVYNEDKQKNDELINKHTSGNWHVPTQPMSDKEKIKLLKLEVALYKRRELALVLALTEKNSSKIKKPAKNI